MSELIRSDTLLGKQQIVVGTKDKDLILQSRGKVKLQQGNSFVDLIKDGEINIPKVINIVKTKESIGKKTGFYYVQDEDNLYAVIDSSQILLGGTGGITGGDGVNRLEDLEDVLLINLRDGDMLVYQGGFWVNSIFNIKDMESLLRDVSDVKKDLAKQSKFTQRTFQDVMETFNMMFDPEGNYFTEKITPLAVHTAQLIVGTNSQQFSLENISFLPNHLKDCNTFAAEVINITKPGLLIHNTMGLENGEDNTGSTWEVLKYNGMPTLADFQVRTLDDASPYYLYAKCSKKNNQGEFILSKDQILLESDTDKEYYHFWVGVLNTPRASLNATTDTINADTVAASRVRSFQTMYGFTEIVGNQITTGVIKDQTGFNYWDMINGSFCIGNPSGSYLWYDSKTGKLFLKGSLTQVGTDSESTIIIWRGQWYYNSSTFYNKGDVVYYDGSTYICTKPCYGNIYPTDTDYWDLYTSKGDQGIDGDDGLSGAGVEWAFKLTDYLDPSSPDYSGGWQNTANGLSVSESWPYLWMSTREKSEGGDWGWWSTPSMIARYAKDGAVGKPGEIGPTIVFRGSWSSWTDYYGTNTRVDVVYYNSSFYMVRYKTVQGIINNNTTPPNSYSLWEPFGASFTSVATGLLVVTEKAAICGWNWNNNVMWSESGTTYLNGGTHHDHNKFPVLATGDKEMLNSYNGNALKSTSEILASMQSFGDDKINGTVITANGRIYSNNATFYSGCTIGNLEVFENSFRYSDYNTHVALGKSVAPSWAEDCLLWLRDTSSSGKNTVILEASYPSGGRYDTGSNHMALWIQNGGIKVMPGNIIDMPGPLFGGRVWHKVGQSYISTAGWGRAGRVGSSAWTVDDHIGGNYRINHNLGHLNYFPVVCTWRGLEPWNKIIAMVKTIESNYFDVSCIDAGTDNTTVPSGFCFVVIGDNTK